MNHFPTLAFTAAASDPASRLRWVKEQAEAVEFSPDPERLDRLDEMVRPFLSAGLSVRYHTRYFEHELGHADPVLAGKALEAHLRTLRAISGLGEPVVTVHTGLDPHQPVHEPMFVENLARLVDCGRGLGITVCLENLRRGPSSEPANVLRWVKDAGAMITLDVGHALGSEAARTGRCPAEGFVDLFADRLFAVHIYGREDDQGHHPIEDIAPFRPLIAKLARTECAWWTVELLHPEHALGTRNVLLKELAETPSPLSTLEESGRLPASRHFTATRPHPPSMPDKCLLIVLDGLGDRSHEVLDWRTPLQAADTPHLDRLARNGANGLYHAGSLGEALPSETAHFAMFGYDREDFPGRGPLEALGAGVDLARDEVAILAHFAALEERDGCLALVQDVPRVDAEEVAALIRAVETWERDGIRIRYVPVKGVFGVLVLTGDVSPDITDTGPMRDGRFLPDVLPLVLNHFRGFGPDGPGRTHGKEGTEGDEVRARRTADVLRAYLLQAWHTLREHPLNARREKAGLPPVTGLVTQRAGRLRPVQPFSRRFGLRGLSIASGAVFRGLARYLGVDWQSPRDTGNLQADFAHDLSAVHDLFARYDFIHLHTKAPDEAAHAKNPLLKKSVIETLDQALGSVEDSLLNDPELLVVITADHSTPSSGNMIHSGEPVPLLFHGNGVRRDMVDRFDEIHAAQGCLGGVRGTELMRLILNHLDMVRLEGIRDTPDECLYWPGDYQPLPVR